MLKCCTRVEDYGEAKDCNCSECCPDPATRPVSVHTIAANEVRSSGEVTGDTIAAKLPARVTTLRVDSKKRMLGVYVRCCKSTIQCGSC